MSCPDCGAAPWEDHLPAPGRSVVIYLVRDVTYPSGLVLKRGSLLTAEIRPGVGHFTFACPSSDGRGQELLAVLPQDARVCRELSPSQTAQQT
jgi:hypothetical protein